MDSMLQPTLADLISSHYKYNNISIYYIIAL